MKVKCSRPALHEAIQLASSIVPARTPKPILQCAKLTADSASEKLTVSATDNEIAIRFTVSQVQIEQPGTMVIPAERLAAILHESADETIDLALEDATAEVRGQDAVFRIFGHDPDDFPVLEPADLTPAFAISADQLKRMVHLTTFAAARENTRYAINGVLWEQNAKKLRLVATDGRRLALVDGEVKPAAKNASNTAIIPVKALALLERMLHDGDEMVNIAFAPNQVVFSTERAEISTSLVQGRFPKYADVIPATSDKKAQLAADAFRHAVRRAALLTNEQSRGVQLHLENDTLHLSSSTPEAGDAEITMPVQYAAEPLTIGFNPQFLLDVLRVVSEPELVFELSDPAKPGLLRAGKDFSYVLMPVTV